MLLNRKGINSLQRGVLVVLLDRKGINSLPSTAWPDLKPPERHASGVQVWTGVQGSPYEASSGAAASQGNTV